MFGISGWELFFILVVALVVIGPADMPKVLRSLGRVVANFRQFSDAFKTSLQDTLQEIELQEIEKRMKTQVEDIKKVVDLGEAKDG